MVKQMTINQSSLQKYDPTRLLLIVLISMTVISCVTINIYFPAAAAEKVAEEIVNDVLNSKGATQPEQTKSNKDQSLLYLHQPQMRSPLLLVVNFLFPAAYAGQADISINSPRINSIRQSMQNRQAKLVRYYQSGNIGFTNNGLLASVNNKGLSLKQKSTAGKLIRAENNDRMALYSEIAQANGHPEWRSDIQKTFARTWINKISSGWMYQSASGQWQRK